jgi:glycosyltransferase involved in cell wall biosynthesis
MLKISAVVLTCNEEVNIERCLSSLNFCREIVVVDSGSRDKTAELASHFTDKIFYHPMEGHGSQLNWGIEKTSCDWVFSLDADEEVSPELRREIEQLSETTEIVGYYVNRKTLYLGRWIQHSGWYPQYILRLFHKNYGRCNEAAVHKSIKVHGKIARLKGDILHYSYRNLSHHLRKINEYASIIAEEKSSKRIKFNLWKAVFAPPGEFLKKYLLNLGFLDGFPGFAVALTSAYYTFLKQAKLYENSKFKN